MGRLAFSSLLSSHLPLYPSVPLPLSDTPSVRRLVLLKAGRHLTQWRPLCAQAGPGKGLPLPPRGGGRDISSLSGRPPLLCPQKKAGADLTTNGNVVVVTRRGGEASSGKVTPRGRH